ncbi:MAG: tetratricopeptide repeat protein [Acidobacteria bacterium]|nr:tetratricopeptide repeat protein [Acidobacteriota bacterium]
MRRDLLITALIFTAVGFVAGVIYTRHSPGANLPTALVQPPLAAASDPELPEGHPPLNVAERWGALRQQAEADPKDPRAASELANFLYDIERWEDAIFWYRRVLALDPRNTDARTDLGTCYYNLGRYDEAIAEFNRSLELEPDKPQALYNLAMARLRGKQDRAGARQAYERLRRSHPNFAGLETLAQLLEEGRQR